MSLALDTTGREWPEPRAGQRTTITPRLELGRTLSLPPPRVGEKLVPVLESETDHIIIYHLSQ